jgi:PhzF family phenazine biosynthesis protein
MDLPLYIVDAFASQPFSGNPAAVCILEKPMEDAWLQGVAAEMNLSETAFLLAAGEAWSLRWFTPAVEVDLCGHATLGSAHALWDSGALPLDAAAIFHTKSGLLTCSRREKWIEMDFPAEPASVPVDSALAEHVYSALGTRGIAAKRNRMDVLIEFEAASAVVQLAPDFAKLASIAGIRGFIATSRSVQPQFDFVSRFFAPAVGIAEDPVTGSAHCFLAPYWSSKLGRNSLTGFQASKRGGVVRTTLRGNRVTLGGQAVTVVRGVLGV